MNLEGIRAQEVVRALAADVGEVGHARRLAERLKQLQPASDVPCRHEYI